ncbi:MAG: hypothetical protein ACPGSM_19100 [Thiolinea sp.]
MTNSSSLFGWLTNLACYLFAAVAVIYMSVLLYGYMQIDPIGHFPAVPLWLFGLSLSLMIYIANKTQYKAFSALFLIGLACLVAIF